MLIQLLFHKKKIALIYCDLNIYNYIYIYIHDTIKKIIEIQLPINAYGSDVTKALKV